MKKAIQPFRSSPIGTKSLFRPPFTWSNEISAIVPFLFVSFSIQMVCYGKCLSLKNFWFNRANSSAWYDVFSHWKKSHFNDRKKALSLVIAWFLFPCICHLTQLHTYSCQWRFCISKVFGLVSWGQRFLSQRIQNPCWLMFNLAQSCITEGVIL